MSQNNKLVFSIILCSFISWLFWAILVQNISNSGTNSIHNEIIKNWKNISITNLENEIISITEEASPSVVNIIIKKDLVIYQSDPFGFYQRPVGSVQRKVGWWTGFFITKDGYILTNKHVVGDKNAEYSVITKNGETFDAKVLAIDPLNDLAVIKINPSTEVKPLSFISHYEWENSEIKVWQFAIAIGNALAEFQNSVSLGVISGTNRTIKAENERLTWLLQTDTAINPGNSGGPLVNLDGKVMWINTAIAWGRSQWIWFSIPLSTKKVDYILSSVKEFWEIKKPFLGIKYTILSPQNHQNFDIKQTYWAYILPGKDSILSWSSAEKSWLRSEDTILSVDGKKVTLTNDLLSIIQNKIPWDILKLEVIEKTGKIKNLSLTLWIEK